ncbi:MAG: hypothetical protein ACXV8Q_00510 [Methylobacter sp.]
MIEKLNGFWIAGDVDGCGELRIDFDNDRHHSAVFDKGDTRDLVVKKLRLLADNLQHDRYLDNDRELDNQTLDPEDREIIVRNHKVSEQELAIDDYVFASRWSDCDPNDPWAVGYISFIGDGFIRVSNKDGSMIDGVGARLWPNAMRISSEVGEKIVKNMPGLEGFPFNPVRIAEIFGEPKAK